MQTSDNDILQAGAAITGGKPTLLEARAMSGQQVGSRGKPGSQDQKASQCWYPSRNDRLDVGRRPGRSWNLQTIAQAPSAS